MASASLTSRVFLKIHACLYNSTMHSACFLFLQYMYIYIYIYIYIYLTVILLGRAGYELIYITNEAVGRVGYYQLISGKSKKNNCFSKFSSNSLDFCG